MQTGSEKKELRGLGWLFLTAMVLHLAVAALANLLEMKGIELPVETALIISELTLLIPCLAYMLTKNLSFIRDLGFRPMRVGSVFMCFLLAVLVTPIASFVNVLSQLFVRNEMLQMSDTLTQGSGLAVMLIASVAAPFCEELMFRGIMARRYEKYMGPLFAGLVSSLFFALAHMNVNQAAYAFVLGMIFSVVNKAAGSTYASFIIHACINGGNMILMFALTAVSQSLGNSAETMIESAEAIRNSDTIYYMIGSTLVLALISALIMIPCVAWLSKHEGNDAAMKDYMTRRRSAWLTFPAVIAIILILFIMFGLEPVLSMLGTPSQ
ncbi:MAG: CPBP family intramembrane metalloprotease [Lachnospiraceae bacterium]|nr:CPBP family intramembrane metalloprotease [Lachnospiraceae bacterium]